MRNPKFEESGTAKNIIVKIYPPFAIPKILAVAVGNIEKWPPSQVKDRATQRM